MESDIGSFSDHSLNLAKKMPIVIGKNLLKGINDFNSSVGLSKKEKADGGHLNSPMNQSKQKRRLKSSIYDLSRPVSIVKVAISESAD